MHLQDQGYYQGWHQMVLGMFHTYLGGTIKQYLKVLERNLVRQYLKVLERNLVQQYLKVSERDLVQQYLKGKFM